MNKLVFVNSGMGIGGVERVISLWANYFINYTTVEIATEKKDESFYKIDPRIERSQLEYKINVRFLPVYRIIKMFKFLKNRNLETIIFNKYRYVNSLYILRKFGFYKNIKLVYFSHGGIKDFETFYPLRKSKKIFETFDEIICLYKGEKILNKKFSFIDEKKIKIISNPVSFKTLEKANYLKKEIIFVGRISKYPKGLDFLIEIWSKISIKNKEWKLKIVGDGEDKEELQEIIKNKGLQKNITLIEAQKNIEDYYLESSIFVLTSRYEGMPMVVMEAMECGLPIISFDIDGISNLIEDNENGYLIKKYNTDEYAEKLEFLMKNFDIRKKIGEVNKEKAKEFSIEKKVNQWGKNKINE
ncbi:MAG: glycosyltransferase [Plesiomonas shigelloides]